MNYSQFGSSLYYYKSNNIIYPTNNEYDNIDLYITFLTKILPNIKINNKNIDINSIKNGQVLFGNHDGIIYIFNHDNNKYLLKFEQPNNIVNDKIKLFIDKGLLIKIYFDINIKYDMIETKISEVPENILNISTNISELMKKYYITYDNNLIQDINKNFILLQNAGYHFDYNENKIYKMNKKLDIYNSNNIILPDNIITHFDKNIKITLYERYDNDIIYLFNNIKTYNIPFRKKIIDKLFSFLDFYKNNINDFINNDSIFNFNDIASRNITYKIINNNDIDFKYIDYLTLYNYNSNKIRDNKVFGEYYLHDIFEIIDTIITSMTNISNYYYYSYFLYNIKNNNNIIKEQLIKRLNINDNKYIEDLSNKIIYYIMIFYLNNKYNDINIHYIDNNELKSVDKNKINNVKLKEIIINILTYKKYVKILNEIQLDDIFIDDYIYRDISYNITKLDKINKLLDNSYSKEISYDLDILSNNNKFYNLLNNKDNEITQIFNNIDDNINNKINHILDNNIIRFCNYVIIQNINNIDNNVIELYKNNYLFDIILYYYDDKKNPQNTTKKNIQDLIAIILNNNITLDCYKNKLNDDNYKYLLTKLKDYYCTHFFIPSNK